MNLKSQPTQQINDDQELAKVLAGVNGASDAVSNANEPAMSAMEPPVAPTTPPPMTMDDTLPPAPVAEPVAPEAEVETEYAPEAPLEPLPQPVANDGELGGVKQEAITELRPLVDKLNLPAEEKFDTYLLLIRSTDDKSLIAPAHEAAKSIADEARRAQALLDIIKEIDFLSNPNELQ